MSFKKMRCIHGIPVDQKCFKCEQQAMNIPKIAYLARQPKPTYQGVYNQDLFEFLLHYQGLVYTELRGTTVFLVLRIPFPLLSVAQDIYSKINRIIRGDIGA